MDSKKALLIAAGVVIAVVLYLAFVNTSLVPQPTEQPASPTPTKEIDLSTTVPGTYTGMLPCADCTGIDTTITFNQDRSYSMENTYMGTPSGNQTYTQTGRYEITTGTPFDAGATVIIVDPDRPTTRTNYWVEDTTQIQQLDMDKNKIPEPPNMTLTKE